MLATTGDPKKADKEAAWYEIEIAKLKAQVQNDNRNK